MDDSWNSEWPDGPFDHESVPTACINKTSVCCIYEGNTIDSPNVSKDDSIESYTGEHIEKSDSNVTKPTFKSILQAKKRLQAFSITKQLKKNSKDEKTEDLDKSDKTLPKKSKKAVYPMDKAQAVVQEIEEIKQKEAEEAEQKQNKFDAIMAVAYKSVALKEVFRVKSRSPSSEREEQFKRREIKSRNYRRSDSFKRRSVSPEVYGKRVGKLVYPKNWTEYKEQGLTFVKDEELKSKMFPKIKLNAHELVTKVLTFDGPSPLLESLKSLTVDEKIESIPVSFLRITRSKPTVTYSVNSKKTRASYVSRKQLFHVISRDRRNAIEKLINSASSRSQFQSRTLTSRPWYAKSWRRSADAECKIIENSVGLSFLQTYSDEEEDNESEDIVGSVNIKDNEIVPEHGTPTKDCQREETSRRESKRRDTLTPEEKPEILEKKQKEETRQKEEQRKKYQRKESPEEVDKHSREKGETLDKGVKHGDDAVLEGTRKCQKENVSEDAKKKDKDELNETRKAIKELEEELERRKAIRMEGEKATKKKKKKKSKMKAMSPETEDEDRPAKKKKKGSMVKKKRNVVEGEESSSDDGKLKKYKKKSKRKKNKVTRKKVKAKKIKSSAKEDTSKKTEVENEGACGENPRKKKKSEIEIECEATSTEEIRKPKKKARDKSKEKTTEEVSEEAIVKKKKSPRRDGKHDRKKKGNDLDNCDFLEERLEEKGSLSPVTIDKSKPGRNSRERLSRQGEDDGTWSGKKQKDSKSSRRESVTSTKSDEGTKNRRDFEASNDRKSSEKPKDKSRPEEEPNSKSDTDQDRKQNDQSAKNKTRRSSEGERNSSREREDSKDRRHCVKSESQKENKCKLAPVPVKSEPDWEDLRSKRNRYRHNNYKELADKLSNEFGDFPLERDLYFLKETKNDSRRSKDGGKREIGTPDTEEYRENWEKDSYPIWESDEEMPAKAREKLNSSWESDEEIFERAHQITNKSRPLSDTLDLEIPLNIKPFKRREIVDPDAELRLLKKQSLSLSEERRRLEIQKMRVKELELEVVKEVQGKVKVEKKPKRRRSRNEEDKESSDEKKASFINVCVENEEVARKKGRWDKRSSSPKAFDPYPDAVHFSKIKKEILDDEDSSTNVSSSTSVNTSAVLENEYEEFMKALTSSPKKPQMKKPSKNEASSDADRCTTPPQHEKTCVTVKPADTQDSVKTQVASNVPVEAMEQVSLPAHVAIPPKDIPLIPIPLSKEIKPVPVPSPQIEINTIPKPLINLSLSANITLDIAPKFTAPPSPVATTLHASIKPLPAVQILEMLSLDRDGNESFASPLTDTSLDSFKGENKKSTEKPFVFTGMVLPTKRQLLNKSGLNLGDSDDDEKRGRPLQKLEDIVQEDKSESAKTPSEKEKTEPEAVKAEPTVEKAKEVDRDAKKPEKKEATRSRTPQDKDSRRKRSPDRHTRKEESPRRFSRSKRDSSPRRRNRESPRRRGHSPKRHSPRRRSPLKRRSPPGKRRRSPRSSSPRSRRRSSISPRRRSSPRRSPSPKFKPSSPKKAKSKSPDKHSSDRSVTKSNKPKSPVTINSPLEGLKRSVADSTISDDLLPQPCVTIEEYTHSPVTQFYDRTSKTLDSPKRESLDARIDHALGLAAKEEPRPIPTTYSSYGYGQFSQFGKVPETKSNLVAVQQKFNATPTQQAKSNFVQVGNMVQILPTEDIPMIATAPPGPSLGFRPPPKSDKSQIVQVGNMLQIVPADLPLEPPPLPPEPKPEVEEQPVSIPSPPVVFHEKQSAESSMRLKVAERREEREKRRQEREKRRKEKEKRRKEKEKQRQMRLKQRTENMIKKALELEAEGTEEDRETTANETPTQWPPLPALASIIPSKEAGKSILVRANSREESPRTDKRKMVQFADGVRPGEGTSPSGGEELSSPPPRKKLPKEKRYKKTKLQKKSQKKKVKVKIIKKRPDAEESDEDDDLPPPSPPPGSPPPHIFPPRLKPQPQPAINNIQPYLPGVVSIQTSHSHQQLFRPPQLNLIMHPHHPHHGPPPPPHHGPPPPPHHHGPPPPPPHHHPHHHGPPLPPGPPHFHHGPPPPPPHHHGPPPPPGLGRPRLLPLPLPRLRPPRHHHGPPPPFHR